MFLVIFYLDTYTISIFKKLLCIRHRKIFTKLLSFGLVVRSLLAWRQWSFHLPQARSCLARWWIRLIWSVSEQWHRTILMQYWMTRSSAALSWSMLTCHLPQSISSRWRFSARSQSFPSPHSSKGTRHMLLLSVHWCSYHVLLIHLSMNLCHLESSWTEIS